MSAFTSIIVSVLTAIMTLIAPLNKIEIKENQSDFTPVVRFAVMSDTHIDTFMDVRSFRMQKAIKAAYQKSEECESYNQLDGIMFCGDITDNGKKYQYNSWISTVKSVIKDNTQIMAIVASAHDNKGSMRKGCRDYLASLTGISADWHIKLNGYHFIGISTSPEEDVRYNDAQIEWADKEIAKAVADDPNKPVFFTHHEHVSDTVYGSADGEWGTSKLKSIFEKYPQIVHFSGHSHYPLNDPRSIWQGNYTCIGTGAITYMEFTVDGETSIHPKNYKKTGQFWLVEVDKSNNIRLRGYDVYNGSLLCEYELKNPTVKENRNYSEISLRNSSAPEFENNAELELNIKNNSSKILIPKANSTDGKPIFIYRAVSYNKSGEIIDTAYVVNNYWLIPCYDSVEISLKTEKGGRIEAFAENAYGIKSEALTAIS